VLRPRVCQNILLISLLVVFSTSLAIAQDTNKTPSYDEIERVIRLLTQRGGAVTFGGMPQGLEAFPLPENAKLVLSVGSSSGYTEIYLELPNPEQNDEPMNNLIHYYTELGWYLISDDVYYQPTANGSWRIYRIKTGETPAFLEEVSGIELKGGYMCASGSQITDFGFEHYLDTTSDVYSQPPSSDFSTFVQLNANGRGTSGIGTICRHAKQQIESIPQ
jgi:hypothetical protein